MFCEGLKEENFRKFPALRTSVGIHEIRNSAVTMVVMSSAESSSRVSLSIEMFFLEICRESSGLGL